MSQKTNQNDQAAYKIKKYKTTKFYISFTYPIYAVLPDKIIKCIYLLSTDTDFNKIYNHYNNS